MLPLVLVAILIAVVIAFGVGMGYVLSHGGSILKYAGEMFVWCVGAGVVLWFFGQGWDALWFPAAVFGGFAVFLIPAAIFSGLRNHRERRELREIDGLR